MRPNLPNHRPLLLISAGTGLTLMVWQIAWDRARQGADSIPGLADDSADRHSDRCPHPASGDLDRRTGRFWDGVHQDGDPMTDLKMEVLRRQMF